MSAELYNLAKSQRQEYGHRKSYIESWESQVTISLYPISSKLSNCELPGNEILPTLFSDRSIELLRRYILNPFYFWEIVGEIARLSASVWKGKISKVLTLQAVQEYQSWTTRHFQKERIAVLNGTASPENLVMLTARGAILWDSSNNSWKTNPLHFKESEQESISGFMKSTELNLNQNSSSQT